MVEQDNTPTPRTRARAITHTHARTQKYTRTRAHARTHTNTRTHARTLEEEEEELVVTKEVTKYCEKRITADGTTKRYRPFTAWFVSRNSYVISTAA